MKVTLSEPGVAGDYVVEECGADGSVLVRPDTSIEAIQRRLGGRPAPPEEFEQHFGDLPSDGEG